MGSKVKVKVSEGKSGSKVSEEKVAVAIKPKQGGGHKGGILTGKVLVTVKKA